MEIAIPLLWISVVLWIGFGAICARLERIARALEAK
jgi:hypothetical protein